jgi:hypothetical protein
MEFRWAVNCNPYFRINGIKEVFK